MTDNAWAAGLFEGEGTISIGRFERRGRHYTRPVITLTMTDEWVINYFAQRWPGGHVGTYQPKKGNARLAYRWTLQSRNTIRKFLGDVRPEFRTQRVRDKAALLIEDMDARVQGRPRDAGSEAYREACLDRYRRMKELNRRGRLLPGIGPKAIEQ